MIRFVLYARATACGGASLTGMHRTLASTENAAMPLGNSATA